jgi:FkbM family methyltransferase
MDIGAHDGVTINNTLYFEKYNQWTGINVEPIQKIYDRLVLNRPNTINLNCAVCNTDGTAEFICNTGYTEMISGLKNSYDARHMERLEKETNKTNSITEIIKVTTRRFETIRNEHNVTHIHYLSIDVEGAEMDVIQSIEFEKVFIDVIGFENNYEDVSQQIIEYLKSKGYVMLNKSLDIFMIHTDSIFYNKESTV